MPNIKDLYRISSKDKSTGKVVTIYTNDPKRVAHEKDFFGVYKEYTTGTISTLNKKTNRFVKTSRLGWKRKQY
jgi:hypothetical protein